MAGYEYDVFVSYRRIEFSRSWIRNDFMEGFNKRLELELDRVPRIFWDDQSVKDSEVPKVRVIDALRKSSCLLSILSSGYFASAWCCAEWETFKQRAEAAGLAKKGQTLTVPIRWHDGENYMSLLTGGGPQPIDFTGFRIEGIYGKQTELHYAYQKELNKLAETVGALVRRAPDFDDQWPFVDPDAGAPAPSSPGSWTFKLGGSK